MSNTNQIEHHLQILETFPGALFVLNDADAIVYANARAQAIIGATPEEAVGTSWWECAPHLVSPSLYQAIQKTRSTRTPADVTYVSPVTQQWLYAHLAPTAEGLTLFFQEEKALARMHAETEIHTLIDTIPQLVWTARPDGYVDFYNQRWLDYTGMNGGEDQANEWKDFVHPDDYELVMTTRAQSLHAGTPYEVEYRLREGRTGRYRWFLVRAIPVRDEAGQILKWIGTNTDIHEKKQAAEEQCALIDAIPQFVWIMDPNGASQCGNKRWYDYTGMTAEQTQGDGWLQAIHPNDYQRTVTLWHHAHTLGEPLEIEHRCKNGKNGSYRWFLARAMPVRDETGQILKWIGTSTDIEDQKRAEQALRQTQARRNVLMHSNIIGIVITEGEQIVDANDTFLRMTGYTREDLHAGKINWIHMAPPEYVTQMLQAHHELNTRQSLTPYEKEYVCKDGSRLPVLVGHVTLPDNPSQGIAFVLDNSAHKELDQRKDDFISMASHELRNPIAAMKLQLALLRRQLTRQGMQTPARAFFTMETQLSTINRLVEELLDVSRIQAGTLEYRQDRVDLNPLLQESINTLQLLHPDYTILLHNTVPATLTGDRDRLAQVFTNLIGNAIKYSPNARTVEVDLDASADTATIRVRDYGLGIPREQHEKIFERFYRVADHRGQKIAGLGMGLYIVAEIIKHHGGTISVESEIGKGSTFTVTLPLTEVP